MPYNAYFSAQDKARCVLWMAELGSADKDVARRKFYNENGRRITPDIKSIKRWYEQLVSTGNVVSQTKRGRKTIDDQTVENVSRLFEDTPQISIREAAQRLPLSKSSVHNIVWKKIKL